jgi:hypothetical protein
MVEWPIIFRWLLLSALFVVAVCANAVAVMKRIS